ncbi:MAG: ABC transporter permease [Terriglobales bacterium]|jgi:putative ABC transport system permease protein
MATQAAAPPQPQKPELVFGDIWNFAWDTFCANRVRFALTALGMVIGTASLILVVTIGLSGKQYILSLIQGIGANMIYAEYEVGGSAVVNVTKADYLTIGDLEAVRQQVPGIRAASPMAEFHDRIPMPGGKVRDALILGVSTEYPQIHNLDILAGRYFDSDDELARNKVAVVTDKVAIGLAGSPGGVVGHTIKLSGLPFIVIGTFKERVETFGLSEIAEDTILIPYSASRYLRAGDNVRQLFFSVADPAEVPRATAEIKHVLQSRHRAESEYDVENLTELLGVANKTADALTGVLLLIAAVTLLVSGVGIMNIMLATVSSRIREIGIRKAMGATKREIRYQFLAEAVFISLIGGSVGILIGLALPVAVREFTHTQVPISGLSVFVALLVSSLVGVVFGTVPAARAANLDPVESLRHE